MRQHHCIRLLAVLSLILVATLINFSHVSGSGLNIVNARYDQARSGANLNETVLNTSNVNAAQFGKLFTRSVVGDTYTQPLYVSGLPIPGQGTHNVIFVATEHNNVYAFDADDPTQSAPLWQVNLGPPYTVNIPTWDIWGGEDGILSTPVIDLATQTMYLVSRHDAHGNVPAHHILHALNITTGQEKFGGPSVISASVAGNGAGNINNQIILDSTLHFQRPALMLLNGNVYIGFGATADSWPWHGWVLAYNARNIQQQVAVWCSTPNGNGGGVWASSDLATDGISIYVSTGNGTFDANTGGPDYGDSVVKLSSSLVVQDWFTPFNQAYLDQNDLDMAVTGPLLIPGTNLVTGGGKAGMMYLMDRNNMGHFNASNDNQIVQSFLGLRGHQHNTPVYWNGPDGPMLYVWSEQDYVKAFQLTGGMLNTIPFSTSQSPIVTNGMPSGILALSANGGTSGTGILWGTETTVGGGKLGVLYAMDPHDLTHLLWSSEMNSARDAVGRIAKFNPATIANGKVYLSSFSNQINVYGLLKSLPPPTATSTGSTPTQTLTNTITPTPSPTTVTTNASFYRAINLNGPALVIDGNNWESSSAPNYAVNGWSFCNSTVLLNPPTDANRATMIRCSQYNPAMSLTMSAIPSGLYNVYLYTWQDFQPKIFNISLNGQVVVQNYNSGPAGTWKRLGPWPVNISTGSFTITASGEMANFSGVEVWSAGSPVTNTPTLTRTVTPTNTATLTPTTSNTPGGSTLTPTLTSTVTPTNTATLTPTASNTPGGSTFYRAINLNGPALVIDGNNWESSSAPNYTVNGWSFCNSTVLLNPPTDANRATMIRCSQYNPAMSLTMSAIPSGLYNVYLYTWQDFQPKIFNISLNGQVVVQNYNSGPAGTWKRLGPWPVNISTGSFTITASGEMANFSGVEVWSAGSPVTNTPTLTRTVTPTNTATSTPTASDTPVIPTLTPTLTRTVTPTNTATSTPTASDTPVIPTLTPTNTATSTPTASDTPVIPTLTPTLTRTVTPTNTATSTPTASDTPVIPTLTPTLTSTVMPTDAATSTPTASDTLVIPTLTPTLTSTATPTDIAPTFQP